MKVKWFDRKAREVSQEGAEQALVRGSEFLLAKSNETVPIEEAILKDSGDTDIDRSSLVATVFYDTPYAAAQHEEVAWSHTQGRRSKWLQLTFQEQVHAVKQIMADAMKRSFPG